MVKRSEKIDNDLLPETVTGPVLAGLLGITDRQIRQLAAEGVVARAGRGQYALAESVRNYLASVTKRAGSEADAARTAFMAAKREALELETAEKRKRLMPVAEHDEAMMLVFGALKSEFMSLPARATRDLALRRRLDALISDALNHAAAKIAATAARIERGEKLPDDAVDDE